MSKYILLMNYMLCFNDGNVKPNIEAISKYIEDISAFLYSHFVKYNSIFTRY